MSETIQKKPGGERTGRGGARPGAGRKPGSANRKTREIADRAAEQGVTPLEVMLQAMGELSAAAEAFDAHTPERLQLLRDAADVAARAAPYMHPRLSAVEMSGAVEQPLQVRVMHLDAVEHERRMRRLLESV